MDILQEDKGLIEIHRICVGMNAIWRPTPCHDLGVDGQIEFLEEGTSVSTGIIVAVQSKSGPSYFLHDDGENIKYYPADKHTQYWDRIKLPIILVLHNPDSDTTIYTKIKPQLNQCGPILVCKGSSFCVGSRSELIRYSEEYMYETRPEILLNRLMSIELAVDYGKKLNGIDFLLASTIKDENIYEVSMARYHALLEDISENGSYAIDQRTYDFINRCVLTLHSQKIVEDFLEEYETSWYGEEFVPEITVPLTKLGNDVIAYLWNNIGTYFDPIKYRGAGSDPEEVAREISKYASHRSKSQKEYMNAAINAQ